MPGSKPCSAAPRQRRRLPLVAPRKTNDPMGAEAEAAEMLIAVTKVVARAAPTTGVSALAVVMVAVAEAVVVAAEIAVIVAIARSRARASGPRPTTGP